MAQIRFTAGPDNVYIHNLSNSGLGFFGSAFGNSVAVGEYQQTTYITDGNGSIQGPQVNNIKYLNAMSGYIGTETSGNQIRCIPNRLATLGIEFTHTTAVKTQNAKLYIYDRNSTNNPASGVTTKVAEIIHPTTTNVMDGSGDITWLTPTGSSVVVDLVASPGQSGTSINGVNTTQNIHNWYTAISASPDSIGSKTLYGALFSCEYL